MIFKGPSTNDFYNSSEPILDVKQRASLMPHLQTVMGNPLQLNKNSGLLSVRGPDKHFGNLNDIIIASADYTIRKGREAP